MHPREYNALLARHKDRLEFDHKTLEAREYNADYRNLMLYCQQYNLNRDPKKDKAITPEDFLSEQSKDEPTDWRLLKVYLDSLITQQDNKKVRRRG